MKKRVLFVLAAFMAIGCCLSFAGCSASSAAENTFGLIAADNGTVVSVSSQAKYQEELKKVSGAFGISVQLPASYQKDVECEGGDNELGGHYMRFTDRQNKKADCGGHLFTLHMIPSGKAYEFAQYEVIGKITKDGKAVYDLVKEIPSDVQYDVQDQKLTDSYQSMFDEAKTVIDSVALSEGYILEKK